MRRTRLSVFSLLLSIAPCSSCASQAFGPAPDGIHRLLFIGNSLTYVNDLPGMVQALADSGGTGSLRVEMVAFPDFALVDHWNSGTALSSIRRASWDLVVLQQGASSVDVNRDTLRLFAKRFGAEIAKAGAQTGLYSVWPTESRREDFTRAIESYHLAAEDVGGLMLPVATAWLAAWSRDSSVPLYSPDGLHPTMEGTYLAALVVYGKIAGRPLAGMPRSLRLHSGTIVTIDERWVSTLQQAATEANQ